MYRLHSFVVLNIYRTPSNFYKVPILEKPKFEFLQYQKIKNRSVVILPTDLRLPSPAGEVKSGVSYPIDSQYAGISCVKA